VIGKCVQRSRDVKMLVWYIYRCSVMVLSVQRVSVAKGVHNRVSRRTWYQGGKI